MGEHGMELIKGITAIGSALYLRKAATLIVSDLHIGVEQEIIDAGTLLIKEQKQYFMDELTRLIAELRPKKIIINGDLKHEFGRINRQEWKDTMEVLKLMTSNVNQTILIKGNHDNMVRPLLKTIQLEDYVVEQDCFICHGDRLFETMRSCKTIIIGHEHPAILLDDGIRQERYKCFLLGKYKSKNLIVMPSFNPLFTGSDLNEGTLSPYVKGKFKRFVVSDHGLLEF